jgi:hypothetical protein
MKILNNQEKFRLQRAIDDEYKSWETYNQVIQDFGVTRPFINIRGAEARHIEALSSLFQFYNQPIQKNQWKEKAPHFANLKQACIASMNGEIENVSLYDDLIKSTKNENILRVYKALQSASLERHLPAFKRYADRYSQ